jgi:prevent-host-death family protein
MIANGRQQSYLYPTGWRLVDMETIGAFDAKTHLSSLLERVEKGEAFTITRRGTAIAQLVPIKGQDQARRLEAIEKLKSFGKGRKLGMDWRLLRDAGRRY